MIKEFFSKSGIKTNSETSGGLNFLLVILNSDQRKNYLWLALTSTVSTSQVYKINDTVANYDLKSSKCRLGDECSATVAKLFVRTDGLVEEIKRRIERHKESFAPSNTVAVSPPNSESSLT